MPPWYTGPDPLNLGGASDAVGDAGDAFDDWTGDGAWYGGPDVPNFEGDLPGPDNDGDTSNSDAANSDGLGWWPTTGPVLPQGPVIPEQGPWFPGLDSTIGGAADAGVDFADYLGNSGGSFIGGLGRNSGLDDAAEGASSFMADTTFKFALLGGGLLVVIVLIVVIL